MRSPFIRRKGHCFRSKKPQESRMKTNPQPFIPAEKQFSEENRSESDARSSGAGLKMQRWRSG
jgi:hypothetical protein